MEQDLAEIALDASTNDTVAAALKGSVEFPEPEATPDTHVTLPGGLEAGDHNISYAEVRELTGEHEEILAKAANAVPGNIFHFINVLLECAVVRFGSEDKAKTKKLLKNALVGDRDALILGISKATYGPDIELDSWVCPNCGNKSELVIPLADIPVRDLEDNTHTFSVKLRKGREAKVRLATGSDQLAVFEDRKLTLAERDTLLLSRCLLSLSDADGTEHTTTGLALSYARNLSAKDRTDILKSLNDRQPGPQFDALKIRHDTCGEEVEVVVGIADLFPGLRMV